MFKRKTEKGEFNIMNNKIDQSIEKVLNLFESGNVPKVISMLVNPKDSRPCGSWSLRNKLIMYCSGTGDARGFRQWKEVGRYVKKGSVGFGIIGPNLIKRKDEETGEEIKKLMGFRAIPVFRIEDTEGEPVIYEELEKREYDLMNVAKSWGIEVEESFFSGGMYGCYAHGEGVQKIIMCSPEVRVFYHELAHAGHNRIGLLKKRTKQQKEIVAEFVASVLLEMRGVEEKNFGQSYEYLKSYAGEKNLKEAVLELIGDIEKVLKEIYKSEEGL